MYPNYANELWIATGIPLSDSIGQCDSSEIRPVVSQCNDSIWFGDQQDRSLPSMQPIIYTSDMAGVVWAKLISFELQPQMHKSYDSDHTESMHCVMLKYWYALQGSKLKVKTEFTEICPLVAWCPAILSFQTDMDASLLNSVCSGACGLL